MSTKNALFIGCGAVAFAGVLIFCSGVAWIIYASQDVQGTSVSITSPLDVKVGETFTMIVNVTNERDTNALRVSDVDISDAYLAGFVILSTDPVPDTTMHIPIDNSLSHTFDTSIAAGDTRTFAFTLRAEQAGIFRGDVDVCEGSRFITRTAQTVVSD